MAPEMKGQREDSNPCIELWLLLHVQDISGLSSEELDLILANKKTGSRTHVERLLMAALGGSYNKSNLPLDVLIPNLDLAMEQARSRDEASEDFPSMVGSHVYKLMDKIILPVVPMSTDGQVGDAIQEKALSVDS